MKIFTKHIELDERDREIIAKHFDLNFEHYFLDIETTGLSKNNDKIIIIGVMKFHENSMLLKQYFSEKDSDERKILSNFINLIKPFSHIITFNGNAFDIPFLNQKLKSYHLPELDESHFYSDIYKWVQKISFEELKDRKLKTLCDFFNIERVDDKDANLLRSYEQYRTTKNSKILDFMLLHNFEDVHNLFYLYRTIEYLNPLEHGDLLPKSFQFYRPEECESPVSHFSCLYRCRIQNEKEIHICGILGTKADLKTHFINHVGNYVKITKKSFEMRLTLEKVEFKEHRLLLVNILDIYEDIGVSIDADKSIIKQDERMNLQNLEEVITAILKHFIF